MLIAVAAVFNISAALFVSVFRRYRELSVLRAMGATRGFIMGVFSLQGMAMGFIGGVLGIFLGLGICEFLIWLQDKVQLFPGEVYRIDHVALEIRMSDLLTIAGACMLICFLATLAPARRGSRIKIVEGLRYE
jgi:lipoprotein-releasing system permease protein